MVNRRSPKTIRDREVSRYRQRLHRITGLYLALKAWQHKADCLVLTRDDVLKFFDMEATPEERMVRIKKDLVLWFSGFHCCYAEHSKTKVEYLFLSRYEGERVPRSFTNLKAVRAFIKGRSDENLGTRTTLFTDLVSRVPTQEEIVRELSLLVAGLKVENMRTTEGQ